MIIRSMNTLRERIYFCVVLLTLGYLLIYLINLKYIRYDQHTIVLCNTQENRSFLVNSIMNRVINNHTYKIDGNLAAFKNKIQRMRYNVSCENIIESNQNEIKYAEDLLKQINIDQHKLNDENYIFNKTMCSEFRMIRGYDDHPVKESEKEFPLAFTILIYENVEQFERLLRVIYRPHNIYCVHVDNKTSIVFKNAVTSIVDCFDNVFIASKLENIVYAGISRIYADLNCMNDLMYENGYLKKINKKKVEWKYLMNLAGSEFPLRTNYELTRILRLYNVGNDIEVLKNYFPQRVETVWNTVGDHPNGMRLVNSYKEKSALPHNFTIVKGLAYAAFSHPFIHYMLTSKYALDLLKWVEDTYSPDETYFAMLQHNTQFNPPGGYQDKWINRNYVNAMSRFIIWVNTGVNCYGTFVREICIPSFRDLALIVSRKEFFFNKFKLNYNPIIYQCIEEWIDQKIKSPQIISLYDYCQHPVIKNFSNGTC